jgi:hypothetical protein
MRWPAASDLTPKATSEGCPLPNHLVSSCNAICSSLGSPSFLNYLHWIALALKSTMTKQKSCETRSPPLSRLLRLGELASSTE